MNRRNRNPHPKISTGHTIFIVSAVQFLAPFMMSAVGVALPTIGRFYGASAVSLALVEMVYMLAVTLFLLPVGRLADITGRKKIFVSGVALFALATILLPFSPSIDIFIAIRFLQGIGVSCTVSTSVAILSSVVPKEKRGKAMGIIVACVYLGLSAGPTLAGLMIAWLGWQWIFFASVPLAMAALIFTLTQLKGEWKGAEGESFDWIGSLIYMAALSCLIVGVSHLESQTWAPRLMAAGMVFIVCFSIFEYKHLSPILDIRLVLSNRVFAFSNIATWINYAASFGLTFFFSLYLQVVKGMSAQATGFVLIAQPIIQAALSPLSGTLSDKISASKLSTAGMAICAAGLGVATFLGQDTRTWQVLVVLVIMGLGFAAFSTPNMTTVMGSVEPRHYGIASSLVATMRSIGMLTAMTITTLLLSMFMGEAKVTTATAPQFLQTMHTAFIIFAGLSLVGIIFSMARVEPTKTPARKR
ncbi:MFS transporter [uncultured Desulfobacter sp.]|uniref:MFS transporter n=1 Tax=uncultured Desulfobacter sp. TaxID=240139 RepID=UPI0029F4BAEC|nr:MFS transporter [uncultured Desulfobacter sp.]